jgi:hypothetical protein
MISLRDRRCGGKAMVKRQVGDGINQPYQNIGDQGAERPDGQRHGGQQQHAAVRAEISRFIINSRLVADNGNTNGFTLNLSDLHNLSQYDIVKQMMATTAALMLNLS